MLDEQVGIRGPPWGPGGPRASGPREVFDNQGYVPFPLGPVAPRAALSTKVFDEQGDVSGPPSGVVGPRAAGPNDKERDVPKPRLAR